MEGHADGIRAVRAEVELKVGRRGGRGAVGELVKSTAPSDSWTGIVTAAAPERDSDRPRERVTERGAAGARNARLSGVEGRMVTMLDLKAEFAKLTLLGGRTPQMTEGERKASGGFATLAPFRDGSIFSAKFSGDGAWERHPNGDELVQIIDGSATLHIMAEDGPKSYAVSAGMLVIVPQGTWHRFHAPDGVSLMTATPKPTEHLTVDVEDPRALTAAQLSSTIEEKWR